MPLTSDEYFQIIQNPAIQNKYWNKIRPDQQDKILRCMSLAKNTKIAGKEMTPESLQILGRKLALYYKDWNDKQVYLTDFEKLKK